MQSKVIDLMRHGQPDLSGVYLGRTDCALSRQGRQCSQTRLSASIDSERRWDYVVSSPLQRCVETAEWFAKQQQLPLKVLQNLAEFDFGRWDGCRFETVYAQDKDAADLFWRDPEKNPPPEGETIRDFKLRVTHARDEILALEARSVLVITHSGVIRCMLAEFLQINAQHWARINIDYSSFTQLKFHYYADSVWPALVSSNTPQPVKSIADNS